MGIAKEDVARIFAPFFSTKTEGNGTGLGLSISERIVQNHGGRIEVESVPGAGSVFKVIVPLYQETPGSADRGSEKRSMSRMPLRRTLIAGMMALALLPTGCERRPQEPPERNVFGQQELLIGLMPERNIFVSASGTRPWGATSQAGSGSP